jgi:hypothetical protein
MSSEKEDSTPVEMGVLRMEAPVALLKYLEGKHIRHTIKVVDSADDAGYFYDGAIEV